MSRGSTVNDSATADDLLDFHDLASLVAEKIYNVDRASTPLTIGLYGEWGAGKTSFLMIVEKVLRANQIRPVWFNAWKYSREENLWSALLQTILDRTRVAGPIWRRPIVAFRLWLRSINLRDGAWEVIWKLGLLVVRVLLLVCGAALAITVVAPNTPAADAVQQFLAGHSMIARAFNEPWVKAFLAVIALLAVVPDILWKLFDVRLGIDYSKISKKRTLREKVAFIDEFSSELQEILRIVGKGKPLVVIIDDLDRCLPDQALQVVDAIKVFLDVPGCVFIIAMDREIIEDATAVKYRSAMSNERFQRLRETYVERIIQLPISLPPARPEAVQRFITKLWSDDDDVTECAQILVGVPPYNPRRIKRYVQSFTLARDYFAKSVGRRLIPALIAKLTVIQYSYRDLYKAVIDDPNLLDALEYTVREPDSVEAPDEPSTDVLRVRVHLTRYPHLASLLRIQVHDEDTFIGVDLQPYLTVFRDVTPVPVAEPSHSVPEEVMPSDEPGPAFDRVAYLQRVRRGYSRTNIDVLEPLLDEGESSAVPLSDMFVAQDAVIDAVPVELPRELLQRRDALAVEPRELPQDVSRALVARVLRVQESQVPESVLRVIARRDATRLVLLGDAGSGKSTLARYVAYVLAGVEVADDHPLAPLAGWLPVVVELREYAHHGGPLLDYLEGGDAFTSGDRVGLAQGAIEAELRGNGQVLLIFDGVDEIVDSVHRDRALKQIAGLAARYPAARFVVTSRPAEYQKSALDAAGFRRCHLRDFNRAQVADFVQRWYRNARPATSADMRQSAANLLDAIGQSAQLAELAGNPLLLTVLATVASRLPLSRYRGGAYENALDVLVAQWEMSKLLPPDDTLPYLDAVDTLAMLRRVARLIAASPAGLAGNFVQVEDLRAELAGSVQERYPGERSAAQARQVAQALISRFHRRNFLLSRFGESAYGFEHRTFLETLVADDIVRRFQMDRSMSEEELVVSLFGRRWRDPAWHEVLLLVAGGVGERQVNRAVLGMLDADPHWPASTTVDPNHIVMAIRCIGAVRRFGPMAAACRAAVDAVISLLQVSHTQVTRAYRDGLATTIDTALLPVFAAIAHWPGRSRYLEWYTTVGMIETDDDRTADIAARLAVTMLGDNDELCAYLQHQAANGWSVHQRRAAVGAVALGFRDVPGVLALVRDRAVRDHAARVRMRALAAIIAAQPEAEETRILLRDRAGNDLDMGVRRLAVRTLGTAWRAAADTRGLLRSIAVADADDEVRQAAIQALASGWAAADTFDLLRTRATGDPSDYVRRATLQTLATGWPDDERVRVLLQDRVVDDSSIDVRQAAIRLLADHWPQVRELVALFQALTASSDGLAAANLRLAALRALAVIAADSPAVLDALRDHVESDESADVRQYALETLADNPHRVSDLLVFLRDRSHNDVSAGPRGAALRAIARHWSDDPGTLAWLHSRALFDAHGDVRATAVELVAAGWHDNPDTEAWLHERAAEDRSGRVRASVVRILSIDWSDDPDTLPLLRSRAVGDGSDEVREMVLRIIAADWSDDPHTLSLLRERASQDSAAGVRHAAIEAIAGLWHADAETLPLLRDRTLNDRDPSVRRRAISAIAAGWHDNAETLPLLRSVAQDDRHHDPRSEAIWVIAAGWHDDPATAELLVTCAHSDPDVEVRYAAVEALGAGWHGQETLAVLGELAGNDAHHAVRLSALQAIITGWRTHPEALAVVKERAVADVSPVIRVAAVMALGETWQADPGIVPLLRECAVNDPDEEVRLAAMAALAAIAERGEAGE